MVAQMDSAAFEAIARAAVREDVSLEFIAGRLGVRRWPDGDRSEITAWLGDRCYDQRPGHFLYVGMRLRLTNGGRVHPVAALAPSGTFAGQGEWASPDGVLTVVEVTSCDRDADRRDRVEKPVAYAETGIPVYLPVDRDAGAVTVHSEPEGGRYRSIVTFSYGHEVVLPEPVNVTLDTEELKKFSR